jgi:hypothetical protein
MRGSFVANDDDYDAAPALADGSRELTRAMAYMLTLMCATDPARLSSALANGARELRRFPKDRKRYGFARWRRTFGQTKAPVANVAPGSELEPTSWWTPIGLNPAVSCRRTLPGFGKTISAKADRNPCRRKTSNRAP